MPIGVPKVPYRILGDQTSQWIDIYQRLSRERVLFLAQDLEEDSTNQLISILLYLNADVNQQDVFIYINSTHGSTACGLAIVDTIQYIKSDVNTINIGIARSIAAFVVARGNQNKRLSLPNARFILRQPENESMGQATEIFSAAEEIIRLRVAIGKLYAEFTGKSIAQITRDLDRDDFLSAKQAYEYGIIDFVGK